MVLLALALSAVILLRACGTLPAAPAEDDVTIRGKLFCVNSAGDARAADYDCSAKGERFAIRTESGDYYFFAEHDERARIFTDPRVRSRTFEIKGHATGPNEIEIIHLYGIEDGKRIRLYYHCDVCNIDAYAPGPCWCCQQPFEFREEVVEDPSR